MEGEANHNCGIAAVYIKKNGDSSKKALFYLYKLLLNQQNRGQLSAGVTTYDEERAQLLSTFKDLGTVNEVFKTSNKAASLELFKKHAGNRGIGHVRYATSGSEDKSLAQPFTRAHGRKWKWFSYCWNGNLANYAELKKQLLEKTDYHLKHDHYDTELVMHYISRELKGSKRPDLVKVFSNLAQKFDGCYNLAYMNAYGELVVTRDPYGFRPVVYGWKGDMLLVASESNALRNCGVEYVKNLEPGHLIHVNGSGMKVKKYAEAKKISRCMFEWVYFANVSSAIDKRSVYKTRIALGKQLAKDEKLPVNDKEWIVVSVPDTAKPVGDAMAFELKIKSREGLIRNRYVGRTFIEGGSRQERIMNKFTALKEVFKGKKILLVDDSVVRGTTTRQIVKYIKEYGGAKEVHIRVSCPPIRGPCFYGIDMSTIKELLVPPYEGKQEHGDVSQEVLDRIAKDLNADSIRYQTVQGLINALKFPESGLCTACITGKYPTPAGKRLYKEAWHKYTHGLKEETYSC